MSYRVAPGKMEYPPNIPATQRTIEDPAFIIQPDEMHAYKEIRMLVDRQFLNTKPFWCSQHFYFDIVPSQEGIDLHLRSNILALSQHPHMSVEENGYKFSGKEQEERATTLPDEKRKLFTKKNQRESKQKDRSENRLLSLLFAAVYDINTKRCFLLQGIPPLRVYKHDKNGKRRRVSNFGEVRLFLRQKMTHCISLHATATRTIFELAPEHVALLPATTVTIARIFLSLFYYTASPCGDNAKGSPKFAREALNTCVQLTSKFIRDWERRNYTSDVELACSLRAGENHELYKASESFIMAMISVLPPSKPNLDKFKKEIVYPHGIVDKRQCKRGKHKSCAVCDLSLPNGDITDAQTAIRNAGFCQKYVDAVCKCIALDPPALRKLNEAVTAQKCRTHIWKSILSTVSVHRLQSLSRSVKQNPSSEEEIFRVREFVEAVRWDVARMWIALDASIQDIMDIINKMTFRETHDRFQAVTDLILGTTVSARALFEDEKPIREVLQSMTCKRNVGEPKESLYRQLADSELQEVSALDIHESHSSELSIAEGIYLGRTEPVNSSSSKPPKEKNFYAQKCCTEEKGQCIEEVREEKDIGNDVTVERKAPQSRERRKRQNVREEPPRTRYRVNCSQGKPVTNLPLKKSIGKDRRRRN